MHAQKAANKPSKPFLRKWGMRLLKTVLGLAILLLFLVILVQTPYFQNIARKKAESYLSRKLRTTVRIGHLYIKFPSLVLLQGIYLEDRQKDTLLSAQLIHADLDMWGLLHHTVDLREVELGGLTVKVKRSLRDSTFNFQFIADAFSSPGPAPKKTAGEPEKILLDKLVLDKIRLVYQDSVTGENMTAGIGSLRAGIRSLDLAAFAIGLSSISLDSSVFQLDEMRAKPQKSGVDYAHLAISGLSLQGRDLFYDKDTIRGVLTNVALRERSGFELDGLRTRFLYTDREAVLKDLDLRTPGTHLQKDMAIGYDSIAAIGKDPGKMSLDLDLQNSQVEVRDILFFAPFLRQQPLFAHAEDTWLLGARVRGSLDSLRIAALRTNCLRGAKGLGGTKADLSGTITHVIHADRMRADMDIKDLSASRGAVTTILPPHSFPSSIRIPDHFSFQGHVAGGLDDLRTDLSMKSSSGDLKVKGWIDRLRNPRQTRYSLALQTQALDMGAVLRDRTDLGPITASLRATGQGLDPKGAQTRVDGDFQSISIRQYAYHDLQIHANMKDQRVSLRSSIQDRAIRFDLQAAADMASRYPALQLDWQIDTMDLAALHLSSDSLRFKAHLVADFANTDPDSLEGNLHISHIDLTRGDPGHGGQRLATDSMVLVAQREDIHFSSEMADIDWRGQYKLTQVGQALRATIDKYFQTASVEPQTAAMKTSTATAHPAHATFDPEEWQMELHLRPSPLVLSFIPSLKGTDSIGVMISFNSAQRDLRLSLRTPKIQWGKQVFREVSFGAGTASDRFGYRLQMAGVEGGGVDIYQGSLQGGLSGGRLFATLLLKDERGKDRYRLAAELDREGQDMKAILNPDSLLLNYDTWLVSRDNALRYEKDGLLIHDLKISRGAEALSIHSESDDPSSPVDISFTDFQLSTLGKLADPDSALVAGVLNGKAELRHITSSPTFTADLMIRNLSYKTDTIGDLTLRVNNEKANAYTADISLQGHQSDIRIKGDYFTGEGRMDLKLDLERLNLAAFQRFMPDQVENMKGSLKGTLAIQGKMDQPRINGRLHFDSATITPLATGEPLKLSGDPIEFDADGFNFSKFAFKDSAGNIATIDGNVYTKDYRQFSFDMTLNARNFRLVNAPHTSSRLFYGQLNLDAAIDLTGDPRAALKADGDIRVNKKTNFVVVLPEPNPEIADRLGVVRFVDKDHPGDTLVDTRALALAATKSPIKGFDVSCTIETDSNAVFTMVIDARNGDELTARGRSNLVFGMDKSGKIDLTGGYEVESGSYNLSLDVLKRRFDIVRGSTITWTGDPTSATLDINASYVANTPSIDLIENEIAGRPQADINKFKQKLPFLVTLKMEGELLKPKITFDISLPQDLVAIWPDVDQRLQQIRVEESELNKQVFALLLLNRFVGEDPLESQAGGGSSVGNMAFQSASQILTNQMDRLAASLIKGVNIQFDLNNEQDYSTGAEIDYTELNVGVSKNLFNERISVTVGSNFDVQGTGAPNQNASNLAGNVAVDYKLTQDGRYMIRAYRNNQYQAVVEGEVVETGVSFVLTFDYDRFRELFMRSKDQALQARQRKKPGSSTPAKGASQPAGGETPSSDKNTPNSDVTPTPASDTSHSNE